VLTLETVCTDGLAVAESKNIFQLGSDFLDELASSPEP
jgi:hypothetical protein